MKNILVGAVATAAILTPCIASADTNAVVGIQYANTEVEDFDLDSYGFNGGLSHDFSNGTFFQFDGEYGRLDVEGCCLAQSSGAIHYGVRNEGHALAGFVSLTDFFSYSGLGFGVEGAMYWDSFVLNGSIGQIDFDDADFSATNFAVDGSYFFTPNLALNASLAQTEGDDDLDGSWTSYGIGGEWRLSNNPVSFTLGYTNTDFDDFDIDADTWRLGVNFDFGTGSLRERASNGPSMSGGRSLGRAIGSLPL
jgi:hypothetical protein